MPRIYTARLIPPNGEAPIVVERGQFTADSMRRHAAEARVPTYLPRPKEYYRDNEQARDALVRAGWSGFAGFVQGRHVALEMFGRKLRDMPGLFRLAQQAGLDTNKRIDLHTNDAGLLFIDRKDFNTLGTEHFEAYDVFAHAIKTNVVLNGVIRRIKSLHGSESIIIAGDASRGSLAPSSIHVFADFSSSDDDRLEEINAIARSVNSAHTKLIYTTFVNKKGFIIDDENELCKVSSHKGQRILLDIRSMGIRVRDVHPFPTNVQSIAEECLHVGIPSGTVPGEDVRRPASTRTAPRHTSQGPLLVLKEETVPVSAKEVVKNSSSVDAAAGAWSDAVAGERARKLESLAHDLRRFDDARTIVHRLREVGGPSAKSARWVADAAVIQGVRSTVNGIAATLCDLVVMVHGTPPRAGTSLKALIDAARAGGKRWAIICEDLARDLDEVSDAALDTREGGLRPDMPGLDELGERVARAGHAYVRAARRIIMLQENLDIRSEEVVSNRGP